MKTGYSIEDFTYIAYSPGEPKVIGEVVVESTKKKCPYWTVLPQPPNRNSPKGFYVLIGSPYPLDMNEANEVYLGISNNAMEIVNRLLNKK